MAASISIIAQDARKLREQRRFLDFAHTEQALERQAFGLGPIVAAGMIVDDQGKLRALGDHGIDHLADILARGEALGLARALPSGAFTVLSGAGKRGVESGAPHACLLALVEHGEMRRNLRFERETLQAAVSQKPWMVWILRPPLASSARANRRRARSQSLRVRH